MPGKCFRCKEEVHVAEEKLALGASWHFECYTCAICNKTLDSTNIYESVKAREIYCRPCYKKFYCIPGYGYGPTKPALLSILPGNDVTSSSPAGTCPCAECCTCDVPDAPPLPDQVFVPPPSRQGQGYIPRLPVPRHYTKQVVVPTCPCANCDANGNDSRASKPRVQTYNVSYLRDEERYKRSIEEAKRSGASRRRDYSVPPSTQQYCRNDSPAQWTGCRTPEQCYPRTQTAPPKCTCRPQVSSYSSSRRPKSQTRPKSSGGAVPKCQRCGREVFFAEQVMGYRGIYHVRCFVCYSCGKTLDSTTVNEHHGQLYCKGCYKHKYGTIGVGFGIGAGTLQTP